MSYQDIGHYWVQITNDNAPDLTLYRDTITLSLEVAEGFDTDSLALIALYNTTNGGNWNKTWNLDDNVTQWYGVTIDDGRIIELDLSTNFLTGNVPQEINDLTYLQSLNLSDNSLKSLPLLSNISNTTSIDVSNNNLDFSSIIPNLSDQSNVLRDTNFIYAPQGLLDKGDNISLGVGISITLVISDDYQDNVYQWYKNGEQLKNATSKNYTIDSVTKIDEGNYWATITNLDVPSLQLQRDTITLTIITIDNPDDTTKNDTTIIDMDNTTKNDTTIIDMDDTIPITDIQSLNTKLFAYPNPVAKELHMTMQRHPRIYYKHNRQQWNSSYLGIHL